MFNIIIFKFWFHRSGLAYSTRDIEKHTKRKSVKDADDDEKV